MTVQVTTIQETVQEDQNNFQQIMSDSQLADLFNKHGVQDERKRKLFVRCFFWLMVFSAAEPSRRGSMLTLIGFFLGAIALLYPEEKVDSLSRSKSRTQRNMNNQRKSQPLFDHFPQPETPTS